jgi:hypothetical protein
MIERLAASSLDLKWVLGGLGRGHAGCSSST